MLCFCTLSLPAADPGGMDRWLQKIALGDKEALGALYDATHLSVYGFALSLVRNPHEAEDITQDTYLQIFRSAGAYRPQGKPMAWILTVTRHLALSRLRRRMDTDMPLQDVPEIPALDPSLPLEDRILLESLLTQLGERERQILILHALSGLKHREIASLMDLPLSTVLSQYNRGIKKLKNAMKEAGQYDEP
jgi:RNA polymerase sigma factor (sigma-70 family)